MSRPQGTGNFKPSAERRRSYLRELQKKADEGDPTAITNYLLLDHMGAIDFSSNRQAARIEKSNQQEMSS